MSFKMKTESHFNTIEDVTTFFNTILKHQTKVVFFSEKLSKIKISATHQSAENKLLKILSEQDLYILKKYGLNQNSIILIPSTLLVSLSLIMLSLLCLTITHYLFLSKIEQYESIFSTLAYTFIFLILSCIAGLFFRAHRTTSSVNDIFWSMLSLSIFSIAFFTIQCILFKYQNFPSDIPNLSLKNILILFFNVPSSFFLFITLISYLALGLVVFYVASYLNYGSSEVARIAQLNSEIKVSPVKKPNIQNFNPGDHFNIKNVSNLSKSVQKLTEKISLELNESSYINSIQFDEIQHIESAPLDILLEKLEYLQILYAHNSNLKSALQSTKNIIQNLIYLNTECEKLKNKILTCSKTDCEAY